MYKKAHAEIRKNPAYSKKPEKKVTKKRWNKAKLTLTERKAGVEKRKTDFLAKLEAESEA
jgi:large subunit ribosomal protein L5e